jgi:hypothetical protein
MNMVLKRNVFKRPKVPEGLLNPSKFSNHEEKLGTRNFVIKPTN